MTHGSMVPGGEAHATDASLVGSGNEYVGLFNANEQSNFLRIRR